jgi:hypothetical protein
MNTQRKRLAQATRELVDNTREIRKSFQHVTDLVSARRAGEFVLVEDNGSGPLQQRRPLTAEERLAHLEFALAWNRKGADLARKNEALLTRAIEKELKCL